VPLNPRVTLIIDALAIAALLGTRPYVGLTSGARRSTQGDLLTLGVVALVAAIAALILPSVFRTARPPVLAAALPTTRAVQEDDVPLITIGADEQMLNVGFVGKSAISRTRVRLSNMGSEAVTIAEANTNCRCLRAAGLPLTVPAGGTQEIEVQLEAPAENSNYTKQMTLVAPASRRHTVITVHARVGLPLAIASNGSKLLQHADRSSDDLVVVVANDGPDAVRLLYSTSANGTLVAVTPKESLNPGERRKVHLRHLSQNVGPTSERVSIHTDSPDQPVLSFDVKP
jgi:hypothetical protein